MIVDTLTVFKYPMVEANVPCAADDLDCLAVEMDVTFGNDDLDRLEIDPAFNMGLPEGVVRAYRKRLQIIRSAPDERDFYALKSLHYEKLKGQRQRQRSMRLNAQYRLTVEVDGGARDRRVTIIGIEDYH